MLLDDQGLVAFDHSDRIESASLIRRMDRLRNIDIVLNRAIKFGSQEIRE